ELAYALRQSGCRMLIAATTFKTSDYVAMVEAARADGALAELERVVHLRTPDWDALLAGGEGLPADAVATAMAGLRPEDPINIQYTSGTTGFPKGATL